MTPHAARTSEIESPTAYLPADETAACGARAHVTAHLLFAGAPSAVVDEAELLTSEVVDDAVAGRVPGPVLVRVEPAPAGWAVLVEWLDEHDPAPGDEGYLPLTGTDPAARRRRDALERSPARWRVTDDGLVTTVRIELDRPPLTSPLR